MPSNTARKAAPRKSSSKTATKKSAAPKKGAAAKNGSATAGTKKAAQTRNPDFEVTGQTKESTVVTQDRKKVLADNDKRKAALGIPKGTRRRENIHEHNVGLTSATDWNKNNKPAHRKHLAEQIEKD